MILRHPYFLHSNLSTFTIQSFNPLILQSWFTQHCAPAQKVRNDIRCYPHSYCKAARKKIYCAHPAKHLNVTPQIFNRQPEVIA